MWANGRAASDGLTDTERIISRCEERLFITDLFVVLNVTTNNKALNHDIICFVIYLIRKLQQSELLRKIFGGERLVCCSGLENIGDRAVCENGKPPSGINGALCLQLVMKWNFERFCKRFIMYINSEINWSGDQSNRLVAIYNMLARVHGKWEAQATIDGYGMVGCNAIEDHWLISTACSRILGTSSIGRCRSC